MYPIMNIKKEISESSSAVEIGMSWQFFTDLHPRSVDAIIGNVAVTKLLFPGN